MTAHRWLELDHGPHDVQITLFDDHYEATAEPEHPKSKSAITILEVHYDPTRHAIKIRVERVEDDTPITVEMP